MARTHRSLMKSFLATLLALASLVTLVACGGSSGPSPVVGQINPTFTVGGTLAGLEAGKTVVLQNNGTDALTLSTNGEFTFAGALAQGVNYAVTVSTQPTGQSCVVMMGSGVMGSANVTQVRVTCATATKVDTTS